MEISAIMNIQDLISNRNVKQREDVHRKNEQEKVQDKTQHLTPADMKNKGLINKMADPVMQQSDTKEAIHAEISATGNIIDMLT